MLREIGKEYKVCRKNANYTQEEASERLNVSPRSLAAYEDGERQAPDDIVKEMVKLYNCPLLAYRHLKATSVLREYIPEVEMLQTNGDMAFQLAIVKDAMDEIYETAKDILKDGRVTKQEQPDWIHNNKKIKAAVGKLLSSLAYSDQVQTEDM